MMICTCRGGYPLELQQKCIEIRKTVIGLNGEPIVFNTPELKPSSENHHPYSTIDATLQGLLIAFGLLSLCGRKPP